MMATPYTNEVANAIRLSCLLINEGTKCFKQCLLQEVKKMNKGDLHAVLNDPMVKQKMMDYKLKPRKLLTDTQFSLLYPKKGRVQIDTFDLTLLCQLFSTLCNVQFIKSCTESDLSLAADICRIRNARNILYGHIVKIEMTNSEFQQEWTIISKILRRLGTSQDDIDKWKNESLSPQDCENIRQEMFALIASDFSDINELARSLLEVVDKQKEHVIYQGEINEEMKSLINSIKELCETDASEDLLLKIQFVINNLQKELVNIIIKSVHEPWSTTQSQLKEYSEKILQQQEIAFIQQQEMLEKLEGIKKDTERLLCDSQTAEKFDNYKEFIEILERSKDATKIFIVDAPSDRTDRQSLKILAKALGNVPWDIIIDLDYESRTEVGLHDELTSVYKLKKDYIACTYNNTKIVTEQDTNILRIVKGECGLYILANGCKDTGCPPCENKFGKAVFKMETLITEIFERFLSVKPLLVFMLILNNNANSLECFNQLLQMMKRLVESNDDSIDLDRSHILAFYTKPNIKIPTDEKYLFCQIKQSDGTLRQISQLLQKTFSSENEIQYFFPGVKGPSACSFSNSDMVQMKGILELYHINIGKIDVSKMNAEEVEEVFSNIKFAFLKGNVLTPEALYINNKDQVFVVRHEMKNLLDTIKEEIESRKTWKANRNYFVLEHDPSGGGTTCVRYILYSLRDQYPCAIITQISEKMYEWIQQISEQSRLPILLVLDSTEHNKLDAESVQRQFNNMNIKTLVLFVKCHDYVINEYNELKQGYFYISSKISHSDDQAAFNKLYQINRKKMELNKVFLFGLLAFCEEYQRFHHHLNQCIEKASVEEKVILQIVCFVWRYSHITTKGQIINRILSIKGNSKGRHLDDLGNISDLLVIYNEGLRPAHNCIIDPSLGKIIGPDKGNQLQTFAQLMLGLVEDDSEGKKESTNIMYYILVERSGKSIWSTFLVDLEEQCGKQYVLTFLQEIEKLNDRCSTKFSSHYQMLQARYLMYKIEDPERAVNIMQKALHLKPGQSVSQSPVFESTLLNTYGFLLRMRLRKIYDSQKHKDSFNKIEFLSFAENDTREAVYAFRRAQNNEKSFGHSSLIDPFSFVGEAQVRALLLHFNFELLCKSDHQRFVDFLKNCDNTFIAESEVEGLEALQQFEILVSIGRIKLENFERTLDSARLVKFEFLRLRFDKGMSVQKIIHGLSSQDILYDVGNLVRGHRRGLDEKTFSTYNLRSWSALNLEDLQLIINTINGKIESLRLLRCNYKDIITAMIYVQHLNVGKKTKTKLKKYNISYATECAVLWTKKYTEDQNAHFMLAVLLLVQGLQKNSRLLILEALDHFEKNKKLCLKSRRTLNLKNKRYAIGIGDGLEAVVPIHLANNCELAEFSGRQIGKSTVNVRPFDILHAKLDQHSDDSKTSSHQQKSLAFNLLISQDNILARTVEDQAAPDETEDLV